jgi:hypothetical protein
VHSSTTAATSSKSMAAPVNIWNRLRARPL